MKGRNGRRRAHLLEPSEKRSSRGLRASYKVSGLPTEERNKARGEGSSHGSAGERHSQKLYPLENEIN